MYAEILSLNNRAACHLVAGDIESATASFSGALRALKRHIASGVSTSAASIETSQQVFSTGMLPKIACVFANLGPPQDHVRSSASAEQEQEGGQFIFKQPIELLFVPCGDHQAPPMVQEYRIVEVISYTVIYNLALCRHEYALTLAKTSDLNLEQEQLQKVRTSFQQAASLYAHAQTLLFQNSTRRDTGALHGLSILNNMGHVFSQLDDTTKSKKYFETLFKSIVCVKTSGAAILESSCLPQASDAHERVEAVLDGFLSNVLSYWVSSSRNAPAA